MVMVFVCAQVLYPLSCRRHMAELEGVAVVGLLMVLGLCALLAWRALELGFPALQSGALPLWGPQVKAVLWSNWTMHMDT